jgi:hypothetical protein
MCGIGKEDKLPEIDDIFLVDVFDTSRTRPPAALATKSMEVNSVVDRHQGGQK